MQSGSDIPRIIEGTDPFDDQTASLQFLEDGHEEVDPDKQQLVKEIYALVREKVPDISPMDAREMFIFKFGVSLDRMNGIGLFESKKWVELLVVQPSTISEEQDFESNNNL